MLKDERTKMAGLGRLELRKHIITTTRTALLPPLLTIP